MRRVWLELLAAAARAPWLGPASGGLLGVAGMLVGPWRWWSAAPAALGLGGLLLEAYAKQALKSKAAELKALMESCLQPLVRCLLSLAAKTTRAQRQPALRDVLWAALTAALTLADTHGSRASIYRRRRSDADDVLEPVPELSAGRGDAPVSCFTRGSGEGKDVWAAAEADIVTFYEDLLRDAPPNMDRSRARKYRTFITAPIKSNGSVQGLLTINAENPGDLTSDDAGIMRVVATLCGVALTLTGGWPGDAAD